jgi:toxin ParE1/3/4
MAHRRAPSADSDLDDIWYYVAKESGSLDRADSFIASLTERFYLLSGNPYIGRSRDDLRPGLRSFPVLQYVIIYRIEDDDVVILHVFHGSRDIESFFRQ